MANDMKKKRDYGESVRLGKPFMDAARNVKDTTGVAIRKVLENALVKGGLPVAVKK